MKIQINTLVNGNANRVGTSSQVRANVMAQVSEENGKSIRLAISLHNGETFEVDMTKVVSKSNQTTWWYTAYLTSEQFKTLHYAENATDKDNAVYTLTIDEHGHCELYGYWTYKAPSGRTRRNTYFGTIDNERITIL